MDKKIAVIQFPGSNCEDESIFALKRAGIPYEEFLWSAPVERLQEFAGYFIVGGFSYEDRSRAGVIASLDPVMQAVREESLKGKVVLGICNGAQVLVETGLVPGYESGKIGIALAPNRMEKEGRIVSAGYFNQFATLKNVQAPGRHAFNRKMQPDQLIHIPFAHAEGRFLFEEGLYEQMQANGQLAFQYVTEEGQADDTFPTNPNGSTAGVAAVVNPAGNVMAMMPHPERVTTGDAIFESVADYLAGWDEQSFESQFLPENASSNSATLAPFRAEDSQLHLLVKLIITDTTAYSVEDALKQAGYPVGIERWVLWSLELDGTKNRKLELDLVQSGELLNTNKEFMDDMNSLKSVSDGKTARVLIVESKDDPVGMFKVQNLHQRFGLKSIKSVSRKIVWRITAETGTDLSGIEDTHIFHNPVVDNLYELSHD